MRTTARRRAISAALPVVAAAAGAAIMLLAANRVGAVVLVAFAAVTAGIALLSRPALALGLLVVLVVVLEDDPSSLLNAPSQLYGYLPGFKVSGVEALLALALGATLLDAAAHERLRLPEPLVLPLALVLLAIASGMITGLAAGSPGIDVIQAARQILPLVVVPLLVVNVVRTRDDLRRWIAVIAGLAIFKGVVGTLMVVSGNGVLIDEGGAVGTYLQSTANFLSVLFLAGVAAAAITRAPIPRWVWAGAPFVLAALVLSFRRSFWIAAIAALIIVLVAGSGRVGRRMLVPGLVVLIALGWLLAGTGVGGQLSGPLVERATSLDPSKVRHNDQDRYRLSERRNVLLDLEAHPVAGLGFGQGWTARRPMPTEHPGGRQYVHFAMLWWWMKTGLVGLVAYLALMGVTIFTALRTARRDPDPRIRVAALGAGAAFAGLGVAELTATFVGSEVRTTVLVAVLLGLLAAARQLERARE
jgi:hypothetical protein